MKNYRNMKKAELITLVLESNTSFTEEELNAMTKAELITLLNVEETEKEVEAEESTTEATEEENTEEEAEESDEEEAEEEYEEFTELKRMLKKLNVAIINQTKRRITTDKLMFCRRKNAVRAYMKHNCTDKIAVEHATQYKSFVLIKLDDRYAMNILQRLYRD